MQNDKKNGGSAGSGDEHYSVPVVNDEQRNLVNDRLERMKTALKANSNVELANKIGVPQQSISKAISSGRIPPIWFQRLAEDFGISSDWLLFGEGLMLRGERAVAQFGPDMDEFDYIPMSYAELSAGGGAVVQMEGFKNRFAFRREWLKRVGLSKKSAVMMVVRGDSMEPTLQNHDTVIVDIDRKRIDTGNIYAVNMGDDLLSIKRLESRGQKVRIISDNQQYEPYDMDAREIRVIGQVVWFARQLVWANHD